MRMWKLGAYVLALMAVACGGITQNDIETPEQGGLLMMPLTSTGADGKTYKLVNGDFEITGTQSLNLSVPPEDSVSVPLRPGLYAIRLQGPWRVVLADKPSESLSVELVSPNPLQFTIQKGEKTQVRFLFKLPGEGSADVGFQVDTGGLISGNLLIESASSSPADGPLFDSLMGQSVPVLLGFESVTLTRSTEGGAKRLHVLTSPITLQFGGTPHETLAGRVAPALKGTTVEFDLIADPSRQVRFTGIRLGWATASDPGRQFTLRMQEQFLMQPVLDNDGYPSARSFQLDANVTIEKLESSSRVMGRGSFRITPR